MKQTLKTVAPIYIIAVLLIALNETGFLKFMPPLDRLLSEVGVALLAVGSIHLLDHATLIKEVASRILKESREAFSVALEDATKKMTADVSTSIHTMTAEVGKSINDASNSIVQDVSGAFDDASQILQRQIESIKVMEESNLIGIFASRKDAAPAIRSAMRQSKEVCLMGISLNEFCRDDQGPFREAWEELVEDIRNGRKKARILLIDPYCHGAILRSFSETVHTAGVAERLESDVMDVATTLRQLRVSLGENSANLEVRLYRLAPTSFICHLDSITFVQHYHFWRKRVAGCPIPILEYRKRSVGHPGLCIHTELGQHFEFVWNQSSIPLDELTNAAAPERRCKNDEHFLPMPTRGLEWGAHASGMSTVFIDRTRPNAKMREEIKNSQQIIWIQGITLRAFFDGSPLSVTLQKKIQQASAKSDIRVMLLDPECDQAKIRAYREFLLNVESPLSYAEFVQHHYRQSKLVRDLGETISRIKRMNSSAGFAARTYDSAPHMFILIGDCAAFVEQYSYGKLVDVTQVAEEEQVILGSDMPLIEYRKTLDEVYVRVLDQIRAKDDADAQQFRPQPYPLLKDHFEYAWEQAKPFKDIALTAKASSSTSGTAGSARDQSN